MANNEYYETLTNQLKGDSDAVFEPCKVIEFNSKTLQAKVLGLRTKETKENVIVMFPSFYLGTGVITFPVPGSVGTIFVGPENTSYMFPGQYFLPTKKSNNNIAISDSSPGQFDFLLKLENIEPGDVLMRSLGHAQVFIRNSGEIELLTKKLYRLALNDIDGSLEALIERSRISMGYSEWYNGVHETNEDVKLYEQHQHATIFDNVPNWEEQTVPLSDAERLNKETVLMDHQIQTPTKDQAKWTEQSINVYEKNPSGDYSTRKILSDIDGHPLYSLKQLFGTASGDAGRNKRLRWYMEHSKEGAIKVEHRCEEKSNLGYRFKLNYDKIDFILGDNFSNIQMQLEKNQFTSTLQDGGNALDITAQPSGLYLNSRTKGGITRSYIEVNPHYGKLAHVKPNGEEVAVVVSDGGLSRASGGPPEGLSFDLGVSHFNVSSEKVIMESGSKRIITTDDKIILKDGNNSLEMHSDDLFYNGRSINRLFRLVDELAKMHDLKDGENDE